MKPIYQMSYDEFSKMCWNRWGIVVSCSYITDANGRVVDHRQSEIKVKFPVKLEDGSFSFVMDSAKVMYFRRLRDAIYYVSHMRKGKKELFKELEAFMNYEKEK